MKFAVVAHRRSATNEALVAAARAWGLDSELLEPHTALTSLEPGDVALARLDVREGSTASRAAPASWSGSRPAASTCGILREPSSSPTTSC